MNIDIEPEVFFIGEMKLDGKGIDEWLESIGGEAIEETIEGSDNEQLIELFARRCYKSFKPGLNPNVAKIRKNSKEYHKNILNVKHGSVVAHGHCAFAIENVSRVFTHEIVRNRIGTEFSQESMRYVRMTDINMWIPDVIKDETRTDEYKMTPKQIFSSVIYFLEQAQERLAKIYDIENVKDFATKKRLTSAFRRILPIGIATGICISFNLRSLRWIIEQRTSLAAETEIRFVFNKIAEIASDHWPMIMQDFKYGQEEDGIPEWIPTNSKI